eukprot:SM000431S16074  [mRNA]  locus=s431:12433:15546:- [translate_table: standard]
MASPAIHRLLLLCCFLGVASLTTDCPRKIEVSIAGQDLKEITAYLAERSASVLTTLKGEGDNDIYDCVNITQQYSLRHPSMKNHKIQMKPTKPLNITLGAKNLPPSKKEVCPKGTIPVLRHGAKEVLAAGSVAAFMAKYPNGSRTGVFDTLTEGAEKLATKNTTDSTGIPVHIVHRSAASSSGTVSEYALGRYGYDYIYGATASLNLYGPYVQNTSEYSASLMWLFSGSSSRGDLTVIQAGWEVYPRKYGDYKPHLFIYWTDAKTGNWFLGYGKVVVGYWPRSLLPNLKFYANYAQFGGEVLDTHPYGRHTQTDMGNGYFPDSGDAAYISNIGYYNRYTQAVSVGEDLDAYAYDTDCYGIDGGYDDSYGGDGAYVLFGGSGYNTYCQFY